VESSEVFVERCAATAERHPARGRVDAERRTPANVAGRGWSPRPHHRIGQALPAYCRHAVEAQDSSSNQHSRNSRPRARNGPKWTMIAGARPMESGGGESGGRRGGYGRKGGARAHGGASAADRRIAGLKRRAGQHPASVRALFLLDSGENHRPRRARILNARENADSPSSRRRERGLAPSAFKMPGLAESRARPAKKETVRRPGRRANSKVGDSALIGAAREDADADGDNRRSLPWGIGYTVADARSSQNRYSARRSTWRTALPG